MSTDTARQAMQAMNKIAGRNRDYDAPTWVRQARRACDPATHEHPGSRFDFPCWDCRLDAWFEYGVPGEIIHIQ